MGVVKTSESGHRTEIIRRIISSIVVALAIGVFLLSVQVSDKDLFFKWQQTAGISPLTVLTTLVFFIALVGGLAFLGNFMVEWRNRRISYDS